VTGKEGGNRGMEDRSKLRNQDANKSDTYVQILTLK